MGKIKIHEIAKKLGLTSKEILEKAKSLNLNIKSHLSSVTDEEAKQLEEALKKKDKTEQKNKQNRPCRFVENQICKVFFSFKNNQKNNRKYFDCFFYVIINLLN